MRLRRMVARTCGSSLVLLLATNLVAAPLSGQVARPVPVTQASVTATALAQSPRVRIAHADSALADAALQLAQQFENPVLSASYTKDAPQAHLALGVPIDLARERRPRIASAQAQLLAATVRMQLVLQEIALDADTTFLRAQAREARARLSARTSRDADSLAILARLRRDAGDASDLDVEVAIVFAGQSANTASTDSAAAITALLAMQTVMGLNPDSLRIVLADTLSTAAADAPAMLSLVPLASDNAPGVGATTPPLVAAAQLDERSAEQSVRLEQARRLAAPSLLVGIDTWNPGGPGGLLPQVGLSIPLPLFNRNAPAILSSKATLRRSSAIVAQVRLTQHGLVANAQRDARLARQRAERSARLVASAGRIATLSLLAYQEGAATVTSTLEAQRGAREALTQFTDDIAAMRVANRLLQFLLLGVPLGTP